MTGGHLTALKARRIRSSLLGPPPNRHSIDHPGSHGILQPLTQSDCRPRQARRRRFLTFVRGVFSWALRGTKVTEHPLPAGWPRTAA
jgi:hypothetical protein